MNLQELFKEDPGLAYHMVSSIPFKFDVGIRKWDFPGFYKKVEAVKVINLSKPDKGLFKFSLYESLELRRSRREFRNKSIPLNILSTLLYYSLGVKGFEWGYPIRMYPSAGGLNSIEAYLIIENVEEAENGLYYYNPFKHSLMLIRRGDFLNQLYNASLEQECIKNAAFTIVLTAVYSRTASKYGVRAYRYILLDAGHVGMNIYLVATSLGLGTVCVGAFEDEKVNDIIGIDEDEVVISIYPIGYPSR